MPTSWNNFLKQLQQLQETQTLTRSTTNTVMPKPIKRFSELDTKKRYLQLAFNGSLNSATRIIPTLPQSDRIIIEAGTPFIKKYGQGGIRTVYNLWGGRVVADIKTVDGDFEEVGMCNSAGASAATVVGDAPVETLNLFIKRCKDLGMMSMIDTVGIGDPLKVILKLEDSPDVVVLHKGRDEESIRGKVIQYRHVNRLKSKFDILFSAAGGVGLKEARSAIFNGANIVVVNIVSPGDPWTGIREDENVAKVVQTFLEAIK